MHHGTCATYVPWCMSGSLTRGGEEKVPGIIGRTVPFLKSPQSPHCHFGAVDHAKNPPSPWTHGKSGLFALIGPLRPYCSQSHLILLRCITEINLLKTCIDLETGISIDISSTLHIELKVESRTNIRKVTLNAANERPLPSGAVEHESVVGKSPSGWSPYARRMRNSQFYVSGERPIAQCSVAFGLHGSFTSY